MKKLNLLDLTLIAIILTGISKLTYLFIHQMYAKIFYWTIGMIWIIWLIHAYQSNRDLPGVGPFNYMNGENQLARVIFVIFMVALFFVVTILG